MNILFLTLLDFDSLDERNIYTDLLRKFYQEGHGVYIVSPVERKNHKQTECLKIDKRLYIIKLKIGNIQKTNMFEKGISTIMLEPAFISAIKKYYSDIKFKLVLYSTPPITLQKAVNYVKRRDHAITYLMLKDIFPQNAVDMGVLSKHGIRGVIYKYFRRKEIKLYRESDYIGCMSEANVRYVRDHNPQIDANRIEICPNCIEPVYKVISEAEKKKIRNRLGIPNERLLLVYGGNLGKPQAIPFLIECLRGIENNQHVYVLIVGNGTEYKQLDSFIKDEKPSNVKLMQTLPKEEYENMILVADVGMIFLDHRFTIPNFPSRILSYMQAGIPVLAVTDKNTDIGQVIENGNFGIWVESKDENQFVKSVENLTITNDLTAMGKSAKEYLEQYYVVQVGYDCIMRHFEE